MRNGVLVVGKLAMDQIGAVSASRFVKFCACALQIPRRFS
jgi:hypothetical protein